MPLWILFFTALTLALHSVPAEAPEPEPSAPVEVALTEPVFRRSGQKPSPRWAEPLPAVRLPHKKIPRLPESPVKAGDLVFYKSAGVTGADGGAARPAGKWRYR